MGAILLPSLLLSLPQSVNRVIPRLFIPQPRRARRVGICPASSISKRPRCVDTKDTPGPASEPPRPLQSVSSLFLPCQIPLQEPPILTRPSSDDPLPLSNLPPQSRLSLPSQSEKLPGRSAPPSAIRGQMSTANDLGEG